MMDVWWRLRNVEPHATVLRAGKLIEYFIKLFKDANLGPEQEQEVRTLGDAIAVAEDAWTSYRHKVQGDKTPLPIIANKGSRLRFSRRETACGGPGELMQEPLLINVMLLVKTDLDIVATKP